MSKNIEQLTKSYSNLSIEIEALDKRIKRFKLTSLLGFIFSIVLFICLITFMILAILGHVNPYAILAIAFFVLFLIVFQITLAFYLINKKVLIVKQVGYKNILAIIKQEMEKEC